MSFPVECPTPCPTHNKVSCYVVLEVQISMQSSRHKILGSDEMTGYPCCNPIRLCSNSRLQVGYSILSQSVIAIFFLYLRHARFFSACSQGLVYLRPSNPAVPGQSFSSWIQYNQTVRNRYVLFVKMVCSFFFAACSPGLVYLRPNGANIFQQVLIECDSQEFWFNKIRVSCTQPDSSLKSSINCIWWHACLLSTESQVILSSEIIFRKRKGSLKPIQVWQFKPTFEFQPLLFS